MTATHCIFPTKPLRAHLTNLFLGESRVEMSISIFDHASAAKGGVKAESGIQCTDETSVGCSSGSGLKGEVCKKTDRQFPMTYET